MAANDPKGRFRSSLIDEPQGNADVTFSVEPLVGCDMQDSAAQMMYECLHKKAEPLGPSPVRLYTLRRSTGDSSYVSVNETPLDLGKFRGRLTDTGL